MNQLPIELQEVTYTSFESFVSSAGSQIVVVLGLGLGFVIVIAVTSWIIKLFKGSTGLNNAPVTSTPYYGGSVGSRYSSQNVAMKYGMGGSETVKSAWPATGNVI